MASGNRMDICGSCRFYNPFPDLAGPSHGDCRRHAPMVVDKNWTHPEQGRRHETATEWPGVAGADWCGDYENRRGG